MSAQRLFTLSHILNQDINHLQAAMAYKIPIEIKLKQKISGHNTLNRHVHPSALSEIASNSFSSVSSFFWQKLCKQKTTIKVIVVDRITQKILYSPITANPLPVK